MDIIRQTDHRSCPCEGNINKLSKGSLLDKTRSDYAENTDGYCRL